MKNQDFLFEKINNVCKTQYNNIELQELIAMKIISKNLSGQVVYNLFSELAVVFDLKKEELIAFTEACKKYFNTSEWNLDNYFTDIELNEYNLIKKTEATKLDTMVFKNANKININKYLTTMTYKDIYEYYNNNLIVYDFRQQRLFKTKKTHDGYIKIHNLNKKGVNEITESIKTGDFFDNTIIFNCVRIKNKKANFKFEESKVDGIGDIYIKPNSNPAAEDTTIVSINDGFHRINAIIKAIDEYKAKYGKDKWINGVTPVLIIREDVERGEEITKQSFKHNTIKDIDWIESKDKDNYNLLLNEIINKSNTLKNKVANSINEMLVDKNMIAYRKPMLSVLRVLYDNITEDDIYYLSKDISKKIDDVYRCANKLTDIKEHLTDINMSALLLLCSIKYDYDPEFIVSVLNTNNVWNTLKTNVKNYTIKDYIEELDLLFGGQ